MTTIASEAVRHALLTRAEIALLDLRDEHEFAQGHPLFAAQVPVGRIAVEFPHRAPRRDVPIVLYDDGEGLVDAGVKEFRSLGYIDVRILEGGLGGWRAAGYELFEDVNSYSKAFGELVEHRRHTPSLSAEDVNELIEEKADIAILDARRFEEYQTMSIPTGTSVPGRGAGAAGARGRAGPGHFDHRQLRRPDPQHHRHAVAGQCRPAQSGGGAAQRHDRLDARR